MPLGPAYHASLHPRSCLALLAALTAAPAVFAQNRDPAGAEVLYRAGRDVARRGDWDSACAKFAESQRLDPAPGTLLNLADCEEHQKHLASAWQHFVQAQQLLQKNDSRVTFARDRAAALESRLPRITVRLAEGAPAATRVTRDEQELGSGALGVALPVDPGDHVIVAKLEGHEDARVTVTVREGETRDAMIAPGPLVGPAPATPAPYAATPARKEEPPHPITSRPAHETPVAGYVFLGAGAVGIATGAITGIMALSRAGTVKDACGPNYDHCTPESVDAAHEGKAVATTSTVAFAAGAVLTGVGLYFVLSPSRSAKRTGLVTPRIGVGPTGASIAGAF